jgi:hypothetical protein
MAVDATLLLEEVGAIIESGEGIGHYRLSCMIKAGGQWFSPVKLDYVGIERDYEVGFGENSQLSCLMGNGDYTYLILPHRENLLIDLFIEPLRESREVNEDGEIRQRRYRAVLLTQDQPNMEALSPHSSNREDMNKTGMKTVQFQLLDEALYQCRMVSVGDIFRRNTPMDVLRGILTEASGTLTLSEEERITGVDVIGGFSQTVKEQIVIPHGTPLEDVPHYLQNEEGGIYSAGLGCFLQGGLWYVYPLYNPTRTREEPRTLTIIRVPPNRYYGAERTYRVTDQQIIVVANSDVQVDEGALYQQLNEGNARRFTNADGMMSFGKSEGNRTRLNRQENLYEFEGDQLKSEKTHARWSRERATSNPFKHYSDLARKRGRYLAIEWQRGDINLLYPGMPVKYYVAGDDELQQYDGVLLGVKEDRTPDTPGVVTQNFPASTTLKVFLTREDPEHLTT